MLIKQLFAREILDSRGNPTVEAEIVLGSGVAARASVPSGASTGSREACELRDGDSRRYLGKGVLHAVNNINTIISTQLRHKNIDSQAALDQALCELDGSEQKSKLGANAMLAVSLAFARAYAKQIGLPLYKSLNSGEAMLMPVPMMNVLNGGAHADNNVDIQEFMIMPVGALDFKSAVQMGAEVFHHLKKVLLKQKLATSVGDEGGFAPNLRSNRQALDILSLAVENAGYRLGKDIVFSLDVAASELYQDGTYHLKSEQLHLDSEALVHYYEALVDSYPIISIEDGLDEHDWDGWSLLTQHLGAKIQLVGDDLFVTNTTILQEGVEKDIANAILIKPNQIGTLSETLAAIKMATRQGYGAIISHRSGETEDAFIADLAVACGCGQIKTGSLCRSDRVAKYNQLLRIESIESCPYAGKVFMERLRNQLT